jgi:hypothetical protein
VNNRRDTSTRREWMRAVLQQQARAERAEADADRLYQHLLNLCTDQYLDRYAPGRPCPGCYDACYEHEAATGRR